MRFILSFLLLFTVTCLSAQTLDEAKELYKIGEFAKAKPLFEKELFQKPDDAALNQWYGVCLYETGENPLKAEKYITVAAQKNIQDAFLYLGNIYARTYRFTQAEQEFAKYEKLKRRDKVALEKLAASRSEMQRLRRIALHTENIQIIDSVVVNKLDFLTVYKLSPDLGKIEAYNDVFEGSRLTESTVYFNGKGAKIYYGQPLEGKITLFSMEKLLDGFSNAKQLSNNDFNLSGNLNFPFVLSDGVTIYFAAQDTEGMGGYDLYVTRYNINNDTYLTPEKLNPPFNSTFNDYLYVLDEEKGVGWFASDRFQPENKVCIYTFIPNDRVELVESDDDDYLIKRSYISSIKDSWREAGNYSKIRELARKSVEQKVEAKKDFTFVINDEYTYYTYGEFKSDVARELYRQAHESNANFEKLKSDLNSKRDLYATASASEKTKLAYSINDLEAQYPILLEKVKKLEINARNEEIKQINR